ncbi:MAG: tetratricopeptide repeat protein [Phycisphaerae bacterium]|nr:tetratricopeptide repeat protein [Phycisphaerae bacterium]
MIFIFGKLHLFKHHRLENRDWCEHCGKRFRLMSYTAREFFHLYFIPFIPLGRIRVINKCPRCDKYYSMHIKKVRDAVAEASVAAEQALAAGNVEETIENAFACLQFGDFERVGSILSQLNQDDGMILRAGARMLRMQRKFTEAQTICRQAISAEPENAEGHYLLGEILIESGQVDEGLMEIHQAAELAPDALDIRMVLMDELAERKRWSELLPVMEEIAVLSPDMSQDNAFGRLLKKTEKKARPRTAIATKKNPYATH